MDKIAVIELDTSSVNLYLGRYNEANLYIIDEKISEKIRLDTENIQGFSYKPYRFEELVKILHFYKRRIAENNINTVLCFCSQRFETLRSSDVLLEEIFNSTGYQFVNYGDEYTNLLHICATHSVDSNKGFLINIEPSHINFIRFNRKSMLENYRFDFGTETLAKMFEDEDCTPRDKMQKMVDYCKKQFSEIDIEMTSEEDVFRPIGMGTTFSNIAKICRLGTKYAYNRDYNYQLTQTNFNNVVRIIQDLEADKTKKIKGISQDRADMVASGTAIVKALFDTYCLSDIWVNDIEVCEGVIIDHLSKTNTETANIDVLTASLNTCGYFYHQDVEKCKRIYSLANDLFDELRALHRFTKHHNKILKIACYFAESGKRVSQKNFEKKSLYMVHNADIRGASQLEILVAGFVAGSQNLEEFDTNQWLLYRNIIDESYLDVVKKLAIMVKIGRLVAGVSKLDHLVCDVLGDNCILSVPDIDGDGYKTSDIRNIIPDFKKAFNKLLQVL